jgi:hypothetical protein
LPKIAGTPVSVHAANNAIILQNLPNNAKVEVYNLRGEKVGVGFKPVQATNLTIPMQTKGMYIVKITNAGTFRVSVK